MRKLLFVCLVTLLAGCGSSSGGLSAWAQADQDTFVAGCISTSLSGTSTATNAQADTYCHCVLDVVMSRYSAADFNANSTADASAVLNDGSTVNTCRAKAGV